MRTLNNIRKNFKDKIASLFLFAVFILLNSLHAQNSEGGKPFSFDSPFRSYTLPNPIEIILPSFDLEAMQREDEINDQSKGSYRFGYNHYVNYDLHNSGTWTLLPNGDRLWQLRIKSPGALSINLAFNDFFMPEGGKLFIYNVDKSVIIGAFTTLNNQDDKAFSTDIIQGDDIILEYYEPNDVVNEGRIKLFRVTHGYRGIQNETERAFAKAGTCQQNTRCPVGNNWQNEKNAVVYIIAYGNEICSGALINVEPENSKPYILTASHCGSESFETWVFRFGWESATCSNPPTSPSSKSLTGCVKRASSSESDMLLVEITGGLVGQTIPASYNPYFAGWSNMDIPATSAVCIHHPNGDIKKISEAKNSTSSTIESLNNTAPTQCWRVGQWTIGATEPGSSGSPLFDQNKRIVGQLYGGPSSCGALPSDLYDNYGKFSTSWLGTDSVNLNSFTQNDSTQLKHWLDPNNTGIKTLNGTNKLVQSIQNNKVQSILSFIVYPNPNNGEFSIDLKISKPQNITAKITNILGQTVYENKIPNATIGIYSIEMTDRTNGIYFLELSSDTEKVVKKINIIQ